MFFAPSKSTQSDKFWNIVVSKTSYQLKNIIRIPNSIRNLKHPEDPQLGLKEHCGSMHLQISIDSKNSEQWGDNDQSPFTYHDQDINLQLGTFSILISPNQDQKNMYFLFRFKILNICVSKTGDHIKIMVGILNFNRELPESFKALIRNKRTLMFFAPSKMTHIYR